MKSQQSEGMAAPGSGQSEKQVSGILVILAFFAIYFIWGTTYLANLFGLKGMTPFVLSTLRYTAAAIALIVFCLIKKVTFPRGKDMRVFAISGLLMLVGGSGLVVFGEQYINSGHTAVVIATEPLLFLLLDGRNRRTYLSDRGVILGLIVGFAGIFAFARYSPHASEGIAQQADLIKGTLLVMVSTLFWVGGALYARNRKTGSTPTIAVAAIQHIAGAVVCALIALVRGEWIQFVPARVPAAAWGGLAYLVIMGTLVAFIAFSWLVTVRPPAIVSTHTYVNPVVAVIIGWFVMSEKVSVLQLGGLVMILVGVLLTNISAAKRKAILNAIAGVLTFKRTGREIIRRRQRPC